MNKATIISLLLIFAIAPTKAAAQQSNPPIPYYYFSQYQITEGLPSNVVSCAAQDAYGFLWVGTGNGVCRFDGYHFTTIYDSESCKAMRGVAEAIFVDNENLMWFSTASGKGYYDSVRGTVKTIDLELENPVTNIIQDSENNIWFCSTDLYKYNKESETITRYPSSGFNFIWSTTDSEGQLWSTCSDGRLLRYDNLVDKFKEENISGLEVIAPISGKRLLASTSDGKVVVYDPHTSSSNVIFEGSKDLGMVHVSCLLERTPGEFWIGTNSGINIYYEANGSTRSIMHSENEGMSISSDEIKCISTDREGNIWIGTNYNGLNLWRNNDSAYTLFYPINNAQSIQGTIVRAVTLSDRVLWVGTEDGKLNYLPAGELNFHQIDLPGNRNSYRDILPVGNEIWVSTYGNGIFRYDFSTSTLVRHYQFSTNQFQGQILSSGGDILVASSSGAYRYNPDIDDFDLIDGTSGIEILALFEDSLGRIWTGTSGKGIILLDKDYNKIQTIDPKVRVTSLFEDSRGKMWVTTEGDGAYIIDIKDLSSYHMSKDNGTINQVTCSVVEDEEGMIWISTDNGLCLVEPNDYKVISSYFKSGDTVASQFTYGASTRASIGNIFLGTTNGLLSFIPEKMRSLREDKSVYISSIKGIVADRMIDLNEEGFSALHTKKIVTSYKDATSLRIRYACHNYACPVSYQYQYTLSSRHGSVSEVTSERMALFFNVGYGKHVFTVSLVGSDNYESTKSVVIVIRPPFYKSTFAKIFLILLVLAALAHVVNMIVNWRKNERIRRMEQIEKEKQKELYESKNAFFMNITHEIRTPLSLIKMPVDRMVKSGEYSEKDLLVIQSNTNRLLELTNQLLDIRKFEQKEEKLELTRNNLCNLVRGTVEWFKTMAEDQGVQINVSVPDTGIDAMCARDSIEKIISNLITNALKYGKDKIDLSLISKDGKAEIRVTSNGELIPAKDSEKIFEKFVHGGKGTGLGLPLARALAELQGGRLYLDTSYTNENSFVLELPLENPDSIIVSPTDEETAPELEQSYNDARKDVLVVEDNQDFRLYIAECLSKEYNVFTAANGKAAIEKLDKRKVDLIVSDIMMPVMDGCELCNYVKTTVEYSHIPIILMTAAVGTETRIETLEVGADGYIEKPFPMELLIANISNLFKNRDIAYQQFSKSPLSHFSGVQTNKMDEELMERLHNVMLERMADSTLSINDLSSALNISNSTLFRKIKANTGLNINEYIRLSRLKRAAELLASGKYRVNEVADMVGFSTSSYFSANFQKQFNISPSAFVKNLNSK